MSFVKFDLSIRLLSPMHIGNLTYGFINRTKTYVPYYTMNSAFNYLSFLMFRETSMKQKLISTSFFFYEEDKLQTPDDLRRKYISSKTSTAIDNSKRVAKESQLYNIESIYPKSKDGSKTIILKGSVFVSKDFVDKFRTICQSNLVRIGGELKEGQGKVKIELLESNQDSITNIRQGEYVRELVRIDEKSDECIAGNKEIVFLRKTRAYKKHGNWKWYEGIFFTPFSIALKDIKIDLITKKVVD